MNDLPEWLQPLADLAHSVRAEQLAPKFPHPPKNARPAAVLLAFSEGDLGPELLLTERASTLRNHAGQISFPGGRQDSSDRDVVHTALREAEEEVGLAAEEVAVFGILPTLWLPPSNHAVTPVLGYWHSPRTLHPVSTAEVQTVMRTPISELIDPRRRFSVEHATGWRGPAFDVGTPVPLWGFTAGIVARLFDHLGWSEPWNDDDVRPVPRVL